jgi:glycine/D-amino acid oxidase-like deaminating enzyme
MSSIDSAEMVVIGGGAVGVGCAYALAKAGCKSVLVLERSDDVGTVTTSQGAGLCGQVRDAVDRIHLAMHSVATFRELQRSEVKPDWNEVGSLRLALSERRVQEFQRLKAACDDAGLETHFLDKEATLKVWPGLCLDQVRSVLWCPSDGYMTPRNVAASYRHNAAKLGVRFQMATSVDGFRIVNNRVQGVITQRGEIECRYAINAAGANAYHIAGLAGLQFPIFPVRHEYYVTVPMEGLHPGMPCFRVPELTLYGRVRDGGLLLGGWEPRSLSRDPKGYPAESQPPPVITDWPVLDGFESSFAGLFPKAQRADKSWVGKGWPTFTPDGRFVIGESSITRGFVMAGGCNAHGISGSGGIGRLLVASLLEPQPSPYVKSLSPDRFTNSPANWTQAQADAARVYETYYGV